MSVALVRFTPGAHTSWHRHAVGQTLRVTEGVGLVGLPARRPARRAAVLHEHGMAAVGGFVPADARGWEVLLANLERVRDAATAVGVTAVLHPHVGTLVETAEEVQRVLDGCDVDLCLDSGHLLIGGTDPVQPARDHAERVRHVHLKDVDLAVAERVRAGAITYYEGVQQGLYRPLGRGGLDVRSLVASLLGAGYDGWFVLEQDTVLETLPGEGSGPVAGAGASCVHLRAVLAQVVGGRS
jgi:inosose dehydratase